jgi:hypothetical protein
MSKLILSACVGVALLCGADAQRNQARGGGGGQARFSGVAQTRGSSDGQARFSGVAQTRGGGGGERGGERGERFGRGIEIMEACITEADAQCQLDFEVTALIETVTVLQADKEAGNDVEAPLELRAQTMAFKQCTKDLMASDLPADNTCRVAIEAQRAEGGGKSGPGGKRGPRGKKGGKALKTLTACAAEIDFSCFLDYQAAELVDTITALKAEAEEAGTRRPEIPEEIKAQLELARQCLKELRPDLEPEGTCALSLPAKRGRNNEGLEEDDDTEEMIRATPRARIAARADATISVLPNARSTRTRTTNRRS